MKNAYYKSGREQRIEGYKRMEARLRDARAELEAISERAAQRAQAKAAELQNHHSHREDSYKQIRSSIYKKFLDQVINHMPEVNTKGKNTYEIVVGDNKGFRLTYLEVKQAHEVAKEVSLIYCPIIVACISRDTDYIVKFIELYKSGNIFSLDS